jgi:acyl-coenzyme A synthetase/AMP-(fatty) acid ligase
LLDIGMTYRQLNANVNRLGNALRALGVRKGDRVAIYMPNSPQFVIAFDPVLKIGAIAVPVNPL